jgi:hypothetical protein
MCGYVVCNNKGTLRRAPTEKSLNITNGVMPRNGMNNKTKLDKPWGTMGTTPQQE